MWIVEKCLLSDKELLSHVQTAELRTNKLIKSFKTAAEFLGAANICADFSCSFFLTSQINVVQVTGSTAKEALSTVLTVASFLFFSPSGADGLQ